jgi:hypothetical protein
MHEPIPRDIVAIHRRRFGVAILVIQPANPALFVHRDGAVSGPTREVGRRAVALDEINSATQRFAAKKPTNCRFVDLANSLRFERLDLYDHVHNTPKGSRKIGTFLAGELVVLRQSTNYCLCKDFRTARVRCWP